MQVKKLRAFLRLLSIEEGLNKPLKVPNELKRLYVTTGHIRDLQLLHYRITHDYELGDSVSEYLKLLKKSTAKNINRAKKLLKEDPLRKSKKKIIRKIPEMLQPQTFEIFFRQRQGYFHELLDSGIVADAVLHSIRKIIKDITFLMKLAEETGMVTKMQWGIAKIEEAESLAHELGLFNDNCIAISMLEPNRLKKVSLEEKQLLKSMCSQLKSGNAEFKRHFQQYIPQADFRALFNFC